MNDIFELNRKLRDNFSAMSFYWSSTDHEKNRRKCIYLYLGEFKLWNKLLESDKFDTKEIFNIGPEGNESSIIDLAILVRQICGDLVSSLIIKPIEYFPARPREVKNAFVSIEKAKKELNYNPIANNKDIIIDIVNYILDRGIKDVEYKLPIEFEKENTPKTWTKRLM